MSIAFRGDQLRGGECTGVLVPLSCRHLLVPEGVVIRPAVDEHNRRPVEFPVDVRAETLLSLWADAVVAVGHGRTGGRVEAEIGTGSARDCDERGRSAGQCAKNVARGVMSLDSLVSSLC